MPAEGYEHVRAMPRLTSAEYNKLDFELDYFVRIIEQRVYGEDAKTDLPEDWIPGGCIPASVDIELEIRGGDFAPLVAAGLHITAHIGGPGRPRSFLTGSLSPSRIFDLALVPDVVQIARPQPMHWE